jgi:hypothetical protein
VKIIDTETAYFQSVFNLDSDQKIKNFKSENTVLQFDFLNIYLGKKLIPFTVNLRTDIK